jgi:hypothetical protein
MTHVMLDLETWGTAPNSMIRSIGAVVFDPLTGDFGAEFYANIDDASQEALGMQKDAGTIAWWAEQSAGARAALEADQIVITQALDLFTQWWEKADGEQVWGHGASFDPVLLEGAYHATGAAAPWKFWDVRCCRTVLSLTDCAPDRAVGTHHNALDDAKAQAIAVATAFRERQFHPA